MRRPFVHGFVCIASAVPILLCTMPAHAQSCHTPSLREPSIGGFHVGFSSILATYSDSGDRGDYQGLVPTWTWSHPIVTAEVALPFYRLAHDDGEEDLGLGDLAADVRVALLRTEDHAITGGVELAVTLPTGDADRDLGMGHVMVMPGVWLRLAWEPVSIFAQLMYGRALAGDESHHGHGDHAASSQYTPRVNPMNMEELTHSLGFRFALAPNLGLTARWLGAVPLDDTGTARQVIGPGLQIEAEPLDASIELQLPIEGDPFDVRFVAALGAQL